MANPFAIAQGLGDLANFGAPLEVEEEAREFEFNPRIKALVESGALDSQTARLVAGRERDRIRTLKLQEDLRRAQERQGLQSNDRSLISRVGGIPIGFQLGTFAGIENPIARFAVDLLADPLNFVSGVGVLTKLGHAAKFLSRGGKVMSASQKAQTVVKGAKALAAASIRPEFFTKVSDAATEFDFKSLGKLFKEASEEKFTAGELARIARVDKDLARLVQNEKSEVRGLTAAFQLADKNAKEGFKTGIVDQLASGQRALVRFGSPFTGQEVASFSAAGILKAFQDGEVAKQLVRPFNAALDSAQTTGLKKAEVTLSQAIDPEESAELIGFVDDAGDNLVNATTKIEDGATGLNIRDTAVARIESVRQNADSVGVALNFMTKESPEVRRLMADAMEGSAEALEQLSDAQASMTRSLRGIFDAVGENAVDSGTISDTIDHYVTHIVEFTGKAQERQIREQVKKWAEKGIDPGHRVGPAVRSRFGFKRAVDTIEELEKVLAKNPGAKLKIKTDQIDQIARFYLDSMGQSIVRNRMMQAMANSPSVDGGLPLALNREGFKKLSKADQDLVVKKYTAPSNRTFNNPDKGRVWYFHNDVWRIAKPIVERDMIADFLTSRVAKAADTVNTVAKTALFNLNPFFHMAALSYSNFALLPFRAAVPQAMENFRDAGRLLVERFQGGEGGLRDAFNKLMIERRSKSMTSLTDLGLDGRDVSELMQGTLQLGRADLGADSYNVMRSFLERAEKTLPESLKSVNPFTGAKHINDLGDKVIFGVFHDGYKTKDCNHIFKSYIRNS